MLPSASGYGGYGAPTEESISKRLMSTLLPLVTPPMKSSSPHIDTVTGEPTVGIYGRASTRSTKEMAVVSELRYTLKLSAEGGESLGK